MKKIVLAMLLVAAVTAVAQTTPAPAQQSPSPSQPAPSTQQTPSQPATGGQPSPAQPAPGAQATPSQPAAAPQQKKEIKDPAEYNAYIGALGQKDAAAKISGFEAFITQYPNTVMKEEALEQLMGAYQSTNNVPKMIETAQKVLQVNPNNLKALALLVKQAAGRMKAEEELTGFRARLFGQSDLVTVCDLICGQELTPREAGGGDRDAGRIEAVLKVALDILAMARDRPRPRT